jgi:hypothetical protein
LFAGATQSIITEVSSFVIVGALGAVGIMAWKTTTCDDGVE